MYLFVSPHLDDIALSCGGYVRRLTTAGERVVIVTVCTADAPVGQPLSPSAQHEHWQWQLGDQPYRLRCQEDDRMVAKLGAESLHLGLLDAIYRHDDAGLPLYTGKQFIGGQVHPADWKVQLPALLAALQPVLTSAQKPADLLRQAQDDRLVSERPSGRPSRSQDGVKVFCPLTAGGHVDHVLARRAVEQLCAAGQVQYYEDYPYAQKDPAALAGVLGDPSAWRSTLIALTPAEVEARISAIACYKSQLFAVFGNADSMPALVREYVDRTGGERYWERV